MPAFPRTSSPPAPAGVTATIGYSWPYPVTRCSTRRRGYRWFEYALPHVLVAVDSRVELFPAEVWQQYEAVGNGAGDWRTQLERLDVAFVVTTAREVAFAERLLSAGWTELYRDADGAVFGGPRTIGAVTSRTARLDSRP